AEAFRTWFVLRLVILLTWIGWLFAVSLPWITLPMEYLCYDYAQLGYSILLMSIYVGPPGLIMVLCNALSLHTHVRVHALSWTRSEVFRHATWRVAAIVLPLLLLFAGFKSMKSPDGFRPLLLCALRAAALFVICRQMA